jgi:ring-1,2-phenylacetyl-CoA epoxidase subunit PaaD
MVISNTITKAIFGWLSEIPDPGIPVVTIQEIGMLRDVKVEDGSYHVFLTPTYNACPALKAVEDQIKTKMLERGLINVKISTVFLLHGLLIGLAMKQKKN